MTSTSSKRYTFIKTKSKTLLFPFNLTAANMFHKIDCMLLRKMFTNAVCLRIIHFVFVTVVNWKYIFDI